MIFVAFFITTLYLLLIGSFVIGFGKVKEFRHKPTASKHSFSIVVPFRDEAENLPDLLKSLEQLNYPKNKYESIFVDDDSQDDSVATIERFLTVVGNDKKGLDTKSAKADSARPDTQVIRNIRKTTSPKKDAINTAIKQATYDWIITTDADCIVSKNWLQIIDAFIQQTQSEFIVAPVTYNSTKTFLDRFQLLDFLSLQGTTIGTFGINKPFLCNGANLCYSKAIFNKVNGFEGNSNIASGDDIFLLEKVLKKHPDKVHYLKSLDALVTTKPQPTFKNLLQQRIRWAAKSSGYSNWFSKLVAISVLAMNALLIVLLMTTILGYFQWKYLLFIFIMKFIIDTVLFLKTTSFFKQQSVLSSVFMSSFIYPFFSMFVVMVSLTSSFNWKGRQFKK